MVKAGSALHVLEPEILQLEGDYSKLTVVKFTRNFSSL